MKDKVFVTVNRFLEDLFESIVGAVYLDTNRNLIKTENVVRNILDIDKFLKENDGEIRISYKNGVNVTDTIYQLTIHGNLGTVLFHIVKSKNSEYANVVKDTTAKKRKTTPPKLHCND